MAGVTVLGALTVCVALTGTAEGGVVVFVWDPDLSSLLRCSLCIQTSLSQYEQFLLNDLIIQKHFLHLRKNFILFTLILPYNEHFLFDNIMCPF